MKVALRQHDRNRSHGWRRWATLAGAIAAGVALFVALVLLAGDHFSSLPAVCGACHEMEPEVRAWRTSPHAAVGCYSCHGDPRPVYMSLPAFADRASRLGGYVWAFLRGTYRSPPRASFAGSEGLPDKVCERCHRPERTVTRDGIAIDHRAHAKRNMSCVSCHRRTAHPGVLREGGFELMEECFKCHGFSPKAKATGRCDRCHAKDFDLVPEWHRTSTWATRDHGGAAVAGRRRCGLCHERGLCDDCHRIEMPHPKKGWKSGKDGHVAAAAKDRKRCARCHKNGRELCSGCHHKDVAYDDRWGPWLGQHPGVVRSRGAAGCLSCHDPLDCQVCHISGGPRAGATSP